MENLITQRMGIDRQIKELTEIKKEIDSRIKSHFGKGEHRVGNWIIYYRDIDKNVLDQKLLKENFPEAYQESHAMRQEEYYRITEAEK